MYWSYYLTGGFIAIILGLVILLIFIPIWYKVQTLEVNEEVDTIFVVKEDLEE